MREKTAMKKSTGRKAGLIGIRGKLIGCTLAPLFLLLTVVAFFLGWQVQSRLNKIQEQNIQQQIDAATTAVEAYFEPAFTAANVVAEMSSVKNIMDDVQRNGSNYNVNTSEHFETLMADLQNAAEKLEPSVLCTYIGAMKNKPRIAWDGYVSGNDYNVTGSDMYAMLLEDPDRAILTGAYEDYVTGSLVVTSAAIQRSRGDHCVLRCGYHDRQPL